MKTYRVIGSMVVWTAMMLNFTACSGQSQDGNTNNKDRIVAATDTPQVDIRVNKRYDDRGNLIAFDSTYTSIYKGEVGDRAFMDSVFKDFKPRFNLKYPFLSDPGFNDLFFRDSLMHNDFFHDDFFRRRMEMNQRYMQQMMAEMDSVKNELLHQRGLHDGKAN